MSRCQYVRDHYGVPAEISRRVRIDGEEGVIAEDRGHYIGVNLDKHKPNVVRNYHPTSGVEYLGMGKIRRMTRSQQNYRDYLRGEHSISFAEWMRFGPRKPRRA